MRTIELLAPAKNLECGLTAIDSGADAVYIGGPSFGARVNAPNSLDDIKKLCDYAHLFGARIHVTVNTILNDEELKKARELTFKLYDAGVDALIIQDLGLLNGPLPPLELHASTQQNNQTPEKVLFLERAGFSQVVLARELSLKEIRAIREKTSVKLEAFIHGALCVGVSGRCYLSAAVTGRSANRGECAQLCRVKQSLFDAQGKALARDKYLLSMRDLNQSANIEELIDSGISSFKIEGRLKDVSYVRNITAYYRNKIDEILKKRHDLMRSSFGTTTTAFTPDPNKSFNRGFTEYNTHEEKANYANFDAPGFVGVKIGKLIKQQGHDLTFKLFKNVALHNGDSLNYYQKSGDLDGFRVSLIKNGDTAEIFQDLPKISSNTVFYRNKDAEFEKSLEGNSSIRKLALELSYTEKDGEVMLEGRDESGDHAAISLKLDEAQIAKDFDKLQNNLQAKLSRLGDSVYALKDLKLNLKHHYFIPQSLLNGLRRDLIAKLYAGKLIRKTVTEHHPDLIPDLPLSEQTLGFNANIYNESAKNFYLNHGAKEAMPAYETQRVHDEEIVLTSKHCLRYCFKLCPLRDKVRPQDLYLEIGRSRFKLLFDCKKCLMMLKGPLK